MKDEVSADPWPQSEAIRRIPALRQAMLSLARRRRLNVLWAMLRGGMSYTPVTAPTTRLAA